MAWGRREPETEPRPRPRLGWPTRRENDTLADLARTLGRSVDPTQSEVIRVVTAFNTAWKAIPELKKEINQYAAALDNERRARQLAEQSARVAEKQLATAEDRYQELLAKHSAVMARVGAIEGAAADAKRAGDGYDPPPPLPPQRTPYAEHPQRAETEAVLERAVMGPQHDTVMEDIGRVVRRMVDRVEQLPEPAPTPPYAPPAEPDTDPLVQEYERMQPPADEQGMEEKR